MRDFQSLYDIAVQRKGGADAVEARLSRPLPPDEIAQGDDSCWLAAMAKAVFQAGFSWKVIEAKWNGFEEAFEGFHPARCAGFHHEDLDRLSSDKRIVRHGAKIRSVCENGAFLCDLAREHGGAARFFAHWPNEDYVGLLDVMRKRGARLGGNTGQRVLRMMGKESFILAPDVVARLEAEGVIDGPPSSKRSMAAIQAAFNRWRAQSGRSFTEISQVLGMTIGG